jgi:hypothetical protein
MTDCSLTRTLSGTTPLPVSQTEGVSIMSRDIEPIAGQAGVPRTARTIQISKHAPTNPEIR